MMQLVSLFQTGTLLGVLLFRLLVAGAVVAAARSAVRVVSRVFSGVLAAGPGSFPIILWLACFLLCIGKTFGQIVLVVPERVIHSPDKQLFIAFSFREEGAHVGTLGGSACNLRQVE